MRKTVKGLSVQFYFYLSLGALALLGFQGCGAGAKTAASVAVAPIPESTPVPHVHPTQGATPNRVDEPEAPRTVTEKYDPSQNNGVTAEAPVSVIQPASVPVPQSNPVTSSAIPALHISAAKNGSLTCASAAACEPALALVSIPTVEGLTRCTGFLISPTEVLTNDHCLKEFDSSSCDEKIYLHFSAMGGGIRAQTVSCKSIKKRSHQTGVQSIDYAILELKNAVTDRAALKLATRGFAENEPATLFRVQMQNQNGSYDGEQSKVNCHSNYSTFLYPHLNSPNGALMSFGDCPVIQGNSGSPILNSKGEVGAIEQGFLKLEESVEMPLNLKKVLLDDPQLPVTIGTQMLCLTRECGPVPSADLETPEVFLERFGRIVKPELPRNENQVWKETSASVGLNKVFVSPPECLPQNARAGDVLVLKQVAFQKGINRNYQTEWRSVGEQPVSMRVKRDMTGQDANGVLENSEFGSVTIPICTMY